MGTTYKLVGGKKSSGKANLATAVSKWYMRVATVYVKSFEGENFHSFRGFLLTANVLPLKIFLEYQHHPLTTQSMVPPGLKVLNHESFPYILSFSDEP